MVDIDKVKIGDKLKYNTGSLRNQVVSVIGFTRHYEGIKFITDSGYESHCYPSSFDYVEQPGQQKEQPVKISMDKQYRTRGGKKVVIYTTDRKHGGGFTVVGGIVEDNGEHSVEYWKSDGSVLNNGVENQCDLIEYNPTQDLKLDQPIWVRNSPTGRWVPRHFASVDGRGKVMCWDDGATSHSCKQYDKSVWDYWTATKPE